MVSHKAHRSQGSLCDVSHFLKLLDSDLVRATEAGSTTGALSKFVD